MERILNRLNYYLESAKIQSIRLRRENEIYSF